MARIILAAGLLAVSASALPQWNQQGQAQVSPLASSIVAPTATGAPTGVPTGTSKHTTDGTAAGSYKCYKGTEFPAQSEWLSFDQLVQINGPTLHQGNSDELYNAIISDVKSVATAAKVPPEVILVQVVQESGGQISHVGDAGKSIGLMQVQPQGEPAVRCESGACTPANVLGMLQQGVNGHTGTTAAPVAPGMAFYIGSQNLPVPAALRAYNSGHLVDPSDYSVATPSSTASYVSDMANRLIGIAPAGVPSQGQLASQCGWPSNGQ